MNLREVNPFKILPALILAQVVGGILLGGTSATVVHFPESNTYLEVEIADSPGEREKGLMFRKNLPLDQGMLFVFSNEKRRGFWMKNTFIPLDIIFVNSTGNIVDIDQAVPQPNVSNDELKTYRSSEPAKYVIEANSSFSEIKNIEVGERVVVPTRYR